MMSASNWFTVDQINDTTFIISEYCHPEETHCYLLCGKERALLIDTGLGVCNIYDEVLKLTNKPVVAVATHVHWDHIGGHKHFSEFYAHESELPWLNGAFPLSADVIQEMLSKECELPDEFDLSSYELFQGTPSRLLHEGDTIDLGERIIKVIHTPGHSPGHMCFFDEENRFLFTGDLIYKGTLFANYPSTDPVAYLDSVNKVARICAERIFPGHHAWDILPEMIGRVETALKKLRREGKLCHGSGFHDFGDWGILL